MPHKERIPATLVFWFCLVFLCMCLGFFYEGKTYLDIFFPSFFQLSMWKHGKASQILPFSVTVHVCPWVLCQNSSELHKPQISIPSVEIWHIRAHPGLLPKPFHCSHLTFPLWCLAYLNNCAAAQSVPLLPVAQAQWLSRDWFLFAEDKLLVPLCHCESCVCEPTWK